MDAAASTGMLETALRRDRWIVAGTLALLVVLCWWYLLVMADAMRAMTGAGGSAEYMWLMPMGSWGLHELVLAAVMWIVMMIGMMLPSAAPVVLLYALMRRREQQRGKVLPSTGVFVTGYLTAWIAFSLAAAAVQYGLTEARLMSDLMQTHSALLAGTVLIAAGLYQLSTWKGTCLAHCRSPIAFLSHHWRSGPFRMGVRHGTYCLGCCWAVMCVLFAVGVMNLAWIAALSALVLLEKMVPHGELIARTSAVALLGLGVVTLLGSG